MRVQQKVIQCAELFKEVHKIVQSRSYIMTPEAFEMLADEYMADAQRREDECGIEVERVLDEAKATYQRLRNDDMHLIYAVLEAISNHIKDLRSPGRVIYPMHIVLMVILMARCRNIKSSAEIANFYNGHNLVLQLLLPGMPSPSNFISEATIKNVRSLISEKESNRIFKELFGAIHLATDQLITFNDAKYKDGREGLRKTVGFDGQEMKSSFVRGSKSRGKKGAIVVTVFDCSSRTAIDFKNTAVKNRERDAFIEMAQTIDLQGIVVMCDALNSTAAVTNCITERGGDYLVPLKDNGGNKELRNHIEAIFNREHKKTIKITDAFKDHGRIEELTFEILPAEKYIDTRIKNTHKNVRTLVKYTKITDLESTDIRYYISSIPFEAGKDGLTLRQVRASILDYWFIESYHNVLDTSKLAQDRFQGCVPETLSLEASLNKIALNIITAERNRMSIARRKKTPISFNDTMYRFSHWSIYKLFTTVFCTYMSKDPVYNLD